MATDAKGFSKKEETKASSFQQMFSNSNPSLDLEPAHHQSRPHYTKVLYRKREREKERSTSTTTTTCTKTDLLSRTVKHKIE